LPPACAAAAIKRKATHRRAQARRYAVAAYAWDLLQLW
jgi:hypothetical protein